MSMHAVESDSFAAGLARELAEYCAMQGTRTSAELANEGSLGPESLRNLALVRAEILQIGTVMALATSLADHSVKRANGVAAPCAPMPFEPTFSSIGIAAAEQLIDDGAFFDLTQHWHNATARLSFAINLSKAFFGRPGTEADVAEIIGDAWRRACAALLGLHRLVADHMASAGLVCDPRVERVTLDLLTAAMNGECPCIDRGGRLSIPGWAERRRTPRKWVAMPVQIQIGASSAHAVLIDVSATGVGLEYGPLVPTQTKITVWLCDGRALHGVVGWSKNGRIGARLTEPLGSDDPLLAE